MDPMPKKPKPRYSRPHTIKATPLPAAMHDEQVMLPDEWAALNRLSARSARRILAGPDSPDVVQLSERRVGITFAANRKWQARRIRAKAQAA
jgi:hypothetical protein